MAGAVDVPEVRTDRLLLRAWRDRDAEPFAAMNADPAVAEHLVEPLTRERSDALLSRIEDHWRQHGYGLWAVERVDDGAFVGFTGLARATFETPFTPAVEVGWRLVPEYWGCGFATEAGRAALAFAFDRLGLGEVVSFTTTGNSRSRAVMERIGMRRDPSGDFEHPNVPVGHRVRPHVLYRVTAEEHRCAVDSALDELRRWEDSGAGWRVRSRAGGRLVLALLTCDGGEEVQRLESSDPAVLAWVGDRDAHDA